MTHLDYLLVFLNQTKPTKATMAAVRAAKGFIVSEAEKEKPIRTTKTMMVNTPTPVLTTNFL